MQTTSRIQIGLGVTNPYTRHPVVMAQMAATVQQASRGRLTLSIGKGNGRFLEKAGSYSTPPQSRSASSQYVVYWLGSGRVSGTAFQIDAMLLRTRPPATPVPIFLAAIGPAGWETALRVADGIATVWSDTVIDARQQAMAQRPSQRPFLCSRKRVPISSRALTTLAALKDRVAVLEAAGFDEVIVAYADRQIWRLRHACWISLTHVPVGEGTNRRGGMQRICIFCGSQVGTNGLYRQAATPWASFSSATAMAWCMAAGMSGSWA